MKEFSVLLLLFASTMVALVPVSVAHDCQAENPQRSCGECTSGTHDHDYNNGNNYCSSSGTTAACSSNGEIALGIIDIAGIAYIDDRNFATGNGLWIYLETNDDPGLQRGGQSVILGELDADPCTGDGIADTLVF